MTMPLEPDFVPPGEDGHWQLADFILAVLEERGFISSEQAHVVLDLTDRVIPLSYDNTVQLLRDAFNSMPPWESCATCRAEFLQHKARILNWHHNDHQIQQESAPQS